MREIKFRAWDGQSVYNWNDLLEFSVEQTFKPDVETWEVMQFTGLKDRNGREIYEGDFIMYPDTESAHVDVGVGMVKVAEMGVNSFWPVECRDGEFGVDIKGGELIYGVSEEAPEWVSLRTLYRDYLSRDECEVIGNIYENPELLSA